MKLLFKCSIVNACFSPLHYEYEELFRGLTSIPLFLISCMYCMVVYAAIEKLRPHSSALIYEKVLLVNSTNEDLLSIFAKVVEY